MNGGLSRMFRALYTKRIPHAYCFQVCGVRMDSRKSFRQKRHPPSNPGIENRLEILKMESPEFEKLEQEKIDLDDLESDFMQADKSYEEYKREKKSAADSLAYEITKSKHFKPPKLPNLLMWTEKEQIRNLYQLDPIEWSPEKLSQQFPATPDVVKKLIKSHWKPRTEAAVARHDRSVLRNWSALIKGKFNLDPELKHHFLSFSTRLRSLPQAPVSTNEEVILHNMPQGSTEFSDIVKKFPTEGVTRLNKPLDVSITHLGANVLNRKSCTPKGDSFVVPGRYHFSRELLPLKEYKEKVLNEMDEEGECDELTRKYYDHLKMGIAEKKDEELLVAEGLQVEENVPLSINKLQKYKRSEGGGNLTPQQLDVYMKAEQYKMKIKIPKEKFDVSAVYKVNDCFYDADGKFLYRVPGMNK